MKREDDEKLWDLLGASTAPAVSPFFARNILREIRQQRDWIKMVVGCFSLRHLAPVSGLVMLAFAAALMWQNPNRFPVAGSRTAEASTIGLAAQDYDVVAHLDELLASEENTLWTDNSSL